MPMQKDVEDRLGVDHRLLVRQLLQRSFRSCEEAAGCISSELRAVLGADVGGGAVEGGAGEPGAARAEAVWLPETVREIVSRVDGDPASAAEVIATYLGELPGRRLRIQASLRRGEARAVFAAAESLRTSSETIGARAVAGTCAALGAAAADLTAARSFLPSLMAQCQLVANEIGDYADGSSLEAALARAAG